MSENAHRSASRPDKITAPRRRLYKRAATEAAHGGFILTLDGEPARTPAGRPVALPTLAAAEALAAEWQRMGEWLDPAAMPLTRIVNSALDTVAIEAEKVRADIVQYAGTDLVCYRASEPRALVEAQAQAWNPVLAWAADALDARFLPVEGLMFVAQPAPALSAVKSAVAEVTSPLPLACLHVMTTLTGSVLLALAVARGRLDADVAWAAANVDEDVQMQTWGADPLALARRAQRWSEMEAATRLFALTMMPAD